MKTNIRYYNKVKKGQCSPRSYLKSFLLVAIMTTAALNVHASLNMSSKSDTSEIDIYRSGEEEELELEAWMLDVDLFNHFIMDRKNGNCPCQHIANVDEEKELPLETWMLVPEIFYRKFEDIKIKNEAVADWKILK